ncbi:ImmA/IrrE family metallo-endopeptidase [Alicyclobacillus mali (ex Roth et al. 2021)]|uniref:ImmA/IrrE family metallo-endopeptidase n=1 Tax=Alicyclobacillus mali (ex Roth et al. 2021) TaxID=1123961 RepID=UPI001F5C804B|nr:ImmA/IrrE family metallo-endopeptidase [Alicyclobacillus mali (ex Roth et al. 2021)]
MIELEDRKISLSDGLSPDQEAKTLIHEYAHALMHADFDDRFTVVEGGGPSPERQQMEVEAEAVAYCVASAFGFDTSDDSASYVWAWSGGDKRKLRASLERISAAVHEPPYAGPHVFERAGASRPPYSTFCRSLLH